MSEWPMPTTTQFRTAVKPKMTNRALRHGETDASPFNENRHHGDSSLRG
jgi:hypothetical protein